MSRFESRVIVVSRAPGPTSVAGGSAVSRFPSSWSTRSEVTVSKTPGAMAVSRLRTNDSWARTPNPANAPASTTVMALSSRKSEFNSTRPASVVLRTASSNAF